MPRVTVMPVIGTVSETRLDSLRGCHALYERKAVRNFVGGQPKDMDRAVGEAIRELTIADRHAALAGKVNFMVTVEV